VGEVGTDRIQLGSRPPGNIFRAIQQVARQLHERGVLLILNSRNNEEDAWEPFRRHPEMVLERRHFAAWRINWQDKATNLLELAEELHLGLDSFVMLDNDPVQQAWVEERLPQVHVIAAQDPLDMLRALATQRLFEAFGRAPEDGLRAQSYEAAARRSKAETTAGDREAFLSGLGLIVTVGRASPDKLPRLAQMAQRTNQFNMTTQRYTEGQIGELCASPDVEVLWCSCRDRFADEGITGLAILRGPGEEWVVDTFLLSCRVLGRGVERALAAAMCRVAFARGVRRLRGEYRRTPRNAPAADFYREVGFSPVRSDGERSVWRLTLPAPAELAPCWITLRFEGHEV
jgi:FkbH-like protein